MTRRRKVATKAELWQGETLGVIVAGRQVFLVDVEGSVCAYEDRCQHKGMPISGGRLTGHVLTCPVHGWSYDVRTGKGLNPENVALAAYPVTVEGDDILIELEEADARQG
ncbi:MAG TPA: Rieske 2Fe-2S domain-containing protein [Polyangiaceae bacterium]|nr:Rieske 2Fe-2S domain-containing protein [Polyangiaceae bacterium]